MYTLYWPPTGANMAAHAALIEIGAPHELIRVDIDKGEHRTEAYRKIQPHGRVPALRRSCSISPTAIRRRASRPTSRARNAGSSCNGSCI